MIRYAFFLLILAFLAPLAVAREDEKSKGPSKQAELDMQLDLSEGMLKSGDAEGAMQILLPIVQKNKTSLRALRLKAEAHRQLNQPDMEMELLLYAWNLGEDYALVPAVREELRQVYSRLCELQPFRLELAKASESYVEKFSKLAAEETKDELYLLAKRSITVAATLAPLNDEVQAQRGEILEILDMFEGPGRPIFNGKDFKGWKLLSGDWSVEEHEMISDPIKKNLGWAGAMIALDQPLPIKGALYLDVMVEDSNDVPGGDPRKNQAYNYPVVRLNTWGKVRKAYELGVISDHAALWDAKEVNSGWELIKDKKALQYKPAGKLPRAKFMSWKIEWDDVSIRMSVNGRPAFEHELGHDVSKYTLDLGSKIGRCHFKNIRLEN